MEGISDLKIVGIDEKRPPKIRKEPYIDLYLKLSHQAPQDWCEDFNKLAKDLVPPASINEKEGLFIETYSRHMDDIEKHFEEVKKKVVACNEQYIKAIRLRDLAAVKKNASLSGEGGEQGKLNAVIAKLKFDV